MASTPLPSAFASLGFTRLSHVSYIYTPSRTSATLSPPSASSSFNSFSDENAMSSTLPTDPAHAAPPKSSTPPPDLILFPSWLDAQPKHTAKYLSAYRTLYPSSSIIVITHCMKDTILGTKANQLLWYGPVASHIQSLPSTANILLHSVSNGGALSIVAVAHIYRSRTGKPLPLRAQVLDSSPGKPSFWTDVTAFTMGIPSLPFRLLARILVTIGSFLAKLLYIVLRKQHPFMTLRAAMADPSLLSIKAPRVYIYSKEDAVVNYKAVEEHIVEAREMGFKAEGEVFGGSKHVAHMMMDPARYWKVVQSVWQRGFEREREVDGMVEELLW